MKVRAWVRRVLSGWHLPSGGAIWLGTAAALLIVEVVLSIVLWDWLRGNESGGTTLRNIGLVAAGSVALPLAVWRGVVADRQASAALQQASSAQRSLLNERYQKGTEMLGSPILSVRLGGIYALKRLAAEHPERYHVQIMELFCAFVRNPTTDADSDAESDDEGEGQLSQLSEDVQATITAIGHRGERGRSLEESEKLTLNLRGARLSYARLSGTRLAGANLSRADLRHANFFETHLQAPDPTEPIPLGPDQPQARTLAKVNLESPPSLTGVVDVSTGKPLVWRDNNRAGHPPTDPEDG